MDSKDKDKNFGSEFSKEPGMTSIPPRLDFPGQDAANERVILALHELYRIDENDTLSVQRVWEQLTYGEQQEQDSFKPMESHELLSPLGNAPQTHKKRPRRRLDLLTACVVAILLVGSMAGTLFALSQKSNQQGVHTSLAATSTSISKLQQGEQITLQFKTRHGNLVLGESISDAQPLLSSSHFFKINSGGSYLRSDGEGIQVEFTSLKKITQIIVWSPFKGTTTEGFGIGMSFSQFTQIYQQPTVVHLDVYSKKAHFFMIKDATFAVSVADRHGMTLWVLFNKQQKAVQLVLQPANFDVSR